MLHILLLILKIIGIVLGALLGIILLGIVLVLFVPVRYRAEVMRTESGDSPPVVVRAKAGWLLHIVNIRVDYPADVWLKVRILFFTIFKMPKQEKEKAEKTKPDKKRSAKAKTAKTKTAKTKPAKTKPEKPKSDTAKPAEEPEKPAETVKTDDAAALEMTGPQQFSADETAEEGADGKKRRGIKFSLKGLWIKICKFFQNIWYTLKRICDKIKTIWKNIEYYTGILQSDTFKRSFALCKDELRQIFAYLKPRKLQADLVIGLDDPAATAKILSYYGILYPFVGNHVNIVPDFDRKRLEGSVLVKGKIKMFIFLKAAIRIYFNKDIKRLIKLFMKEDV